MDGGLFSVRLFSNTTSIKFLPSFCFITGLHLICIFFLRAGGDAGTTSNAAEVHGYNRNLLIFTNTLFDYRLYSTDNHLRVENKANSLSDHVTLYIGDERVEVNNYRGYQAVYDSKYLFTLNGQKPSKRYPHAHVEYDIWLSMNRVISGSHRSGTGLCKVAIKWLHSC